MSSTPVYLLADLSPEVVDRSAQDDTVLLVERDHDSDEKDAQRNIQTVRIKFSAAQCLATSLDVVNISFAEIQSIASGGPGGVYDPHARPPPRQGGGTICAIVSDLYASPVGLATITPLNVGEFLGPYPLDAQVNIADGETNSVDAITARREPRPRVHTIWGLG
ncbi:hypothetical protein B0T16DRAFT_450385 [Cercophora newfieldiana]|uniref:Uncharacterized protein n=1 Tax=Cercophora newfieldiana TaxID=92897 RepID=A0AA39XTE4_9PEZI|nr:hypothetical protein B0T16DRAFT_450385 [Cercophora newfieldiana]